MLTFLEKGCRRRQLRGPDGIGLANLAEIALKPRPLLVPRAWVPPSSGDGAFPLSRWLQ